MNVWRSRAAGPARAAPTPPPSGDGAETPSPATPSPASPAPPSVRPPASVTNAAAAPEPEAEMPFLDHLEELRWRIVKALAGVLVCSVICLVFADWIIDGVLLAPTRPDFAPYAWLRIDAVAVVLQNRTVTGQFFAYYGTVLATGIVLASPLAVYQIWKFIEPALYPDEKSGVRFASVFATAFFGAGIAFGYLVLTPIALQFFAKFEIADTIVNEFDISRYFSMVLTWSFGSALLFELPVVVYVFARVGVLTEAVLRSGRRYALIVILVLSAFVTPPDPLSMVILAVPLLGLYEVSIWITRKVEARLAREAAREAAEEAQRKAADA